MPGDNGAVFGCGSCRNTKGIGIWKLPTPRNDDCKQWREQWLNELTKSRVVGKDFQRLIDNDRVYTCEKHFAPDDIEIFHSEKMTKKKPKFGALPTVNMPKKSHHSRKPVMRPSRSIVKDHEDSKINKRIYNNFEEL